MEKSPLFWNPSFSHAFVLIPAHRHLIVWRNAAKLGECLFVEYFSSIVDFYSTYYKHFVSSSFHVFHIFSLSLQSKREPVLGIPKKSRSSRSLTRQTRLSPPRPTPSRPAPGRWATRPAGGCSPGTMLKTRPACSGRSGRPRRSSSCTTTSPSSSHFAGLLQKIIFFKRRPQDAKDFSYVLIQVHDKPLLMGIHSHFNLCWPHEKDKYPFQSWILNWLV